MTIHRTDTRVSRFFFVLFLSSIIIIGVGAGSADALHLVNPQPNVHVNVSANGTATMDLELVYDLESTDEQAAFSSIETDTPTQTDLANRYHERITTVAATAENTTNRNMTVSPATITFERYNDNTTGTITLSVTWTNLAATTDSQLVITEPFASGFTTDRLFILTLPPDYTPTTIDPEPTRTYEHSLIWDANTDLSGFTVIATPHETTTTTPTPTQTDTPTPTQTDDTTSTPTQPGFGILLTTIALLSFLVARHRRA